jgi:hypothetical protein
LWHEDCLLSVVQSEIVLGEALLVDHCSAD